MTTPFPIPQKLMVEKGIMMDRQHYSAPSGGAGYHHAHSGFGYGGHGGHSGYGGGHPEYHTYDYTSSGHDSHQHSSDKGNNNLAISALTLLAFLFFLNILQQCLKEHMESMTTPQPVVMMTAAAAGRLETNPEIQKRKGENGEQATENNAMDGIVDPGQLNLADVYPNISMKFVRNGNHMHKEVKKGAIIHKISLN